VNRERLRRIQDFNEVRRIAVRLPVDSQQEAIEHVAKSELQHTVLRKKMACFEIKAGQHKS
jgi:hypothetical protein